MELKRRYISYSKTKQNKIKQKISKTELFQTVYSFEGSIHSVFLHLLISYHISETGANIYIRGLKLKASKEQLSHRGEAEWAKSKMKWVGGSLCIANQLYSLNTVLFFNFFSQKIG